MSNGHHAVDGKKVIFAYDRWCFVRGVNEYHTFWKFLKTDDTVAMSGWHGSYHIHPDGMKRLDMLLGPNYITFIKAYLARTKDERRVRKSKRSRKGN